jgi:hypothetical protein
VNGFKAVIVCSIWRAHFAVWRSEAVDAEARAQRKLDNIKAEIIKMWRLNILFSERRSVLISNPIIGPNRPFACDEFHAMGLRFGCLQSWSPRAISVP